MNTFMTGDYIDDVVNIDGFPQHIMVFANTIYGDILRGADDYGVLLSPEQKYGGIAVWQRDNFFIGYGVNLKRFDIGIYGSPMEDRNRIGIGVGRAYFTTRLDLSAIVNKETNIDEYWELNIRGLKRKGDYILMLRYGFRNTTAFYEYSQHRIGLMAQRLVLNEGFVYLAAEFNILDGDYTDDFALVFAGLELPLNRTFSFRIGCREAFNEANDFVPDTWEVQPGICVKIRDFSFDFHLNKERFFDKDLTFINSCGLDLNFGSF
jgi:hypothetical protein